MKLTKINLNNPLLKNYKNPPTPPTLPLSTPTQPLYPPNYISLRLKSFNTIDISLSKPQQPHPKLLSQQTFRDNYKSKSSSKTKTISLNQLEENQQVEIRVNHKRSMRNQLNQILIQIEPQISKTVPSNTIRKVKQYYAGSSLNIIPKQEYSKQYKRQQNQQIPNFIKIHLEKDIYQTKLLNQYNSRESIEHGGKTKKKVNKMLLPPLPNSHRKDKQKQRGKEDEEKNSNCITFQPYITEYKLLETRNRSKDGKIKNSQRYLSQQKTKRIVCPKYSMENIVMSADICGWEPEDPSDKRSSSFICYSDLYKDVYDRAIASKNKTIQLPSKPQPLSLPLQFIQIRSIGIGAASSVYLVCELKTRTIYAMKIIAKSVKLKHKDLLCEEIKIHFKLNHENIVSLYHIYNDEGSLKLILEYGASTLIDLVKQRSKITEKEAARIIKEVLTGVDYIHKQGVTHRDLKLENILVVNKVVKICDFGLAKRQTVFESDDLVGTIDYLSPEIVKEKKYTYKTDIWAVGVILWELIHGVSTFLKETKEANKYIELIKLDTEGIDYGSCSGELRDFLKKIFVKEELRADAWELLGQRFIVENLEEENGSTPQF